MRDRKYQKPNWSRDLEMVLLGAMSFSQLVQRHRGYVPSFVKKHGKRRAYWMTPDDLVQEGWLAVSNSFGTYIPEKGPLAAWVNGNLKWAVRRQADRSRRKEQQELAFIEHEVVQECVVDFPTRHHEPPAAELNYDVAKRVAYLEKEFRKSSRKAGDRKVQALQLFLKGMSANDVLAQTYGGDTPPNRKQLRRAIADGCELMESSFPKYERLIATRTPQNANGKETSNDRLRPLRKAGESDLDQGKQNAAS